MTHSHISRFHIIAIIVSQGYCFKTTGPITLKISQSESWNSMPYLQKDIPQILLLVILDGWSKYFKIYKALYVYAHLLKARLRYSLGWW